MARPRKRRRVCSLPDHLSFGPINGKDSREEVILSIDEFEVIRLIDLEGLEQKEAAERMEVARSTVQRIYQEAKLKVADTIVNGKNLRIEGGSYKLCSLGEEHCPSCSGGRHRRGPGKGRGMGRGQARGRI